jgi:hypothetical protein
MTEGKRREDAERKKNDRKRKDAMETLFHLDKKSHANRRLMKSACRRGKKNQRKAHFEGKCFHLCLRRKNSHSVAPCHPRRSSTVQLACFHQNIPEVLMERQGKEALQLDGHLVEI